MNHRTTGRRALAGGALALAATLALTGCGGTESGASEAPKKPELKVAGAYIPEPTTNDMAAGFFTLTNRGGGRQPTSATSKRRAAAGRRRGVRGASREHRSRFPRAPRARRPAGADGSAERSAQLARQRAAMATAREKRVRDADPHRSGLRRSVLTEAAVAVALLAVTTVLTTTEPGRTEEEAASATSAAAAQRSGPLVVKVPFDTGAKDGKGVVRLDLDPGRNGSNDLHVYVKRPNGSAFDVPEVKVSFTLKEKDVGPLPVTPDHIATGHWTASGVQIPMAGDWEIKVTVRTSDIDQVTVDKNAQIG
ncbi:hypothetical protein SALBM135S_03338 [Streptomyces alboniger]